MQAELIADTIKPRHEARIMELFEKRGVVSMTGQILMQRRRDCNTLPIQYRVPLNLIVRKSTGRAPVK